MLDDYSYSVCDVYRFLCVAEHPRRYVHVQKLLINRSDVTRTGLRFSRDNFRKGLGTCEMCHVMSSSQCQLSGDACVCVCVSVCVPLEV